MEVIWLFGFKKRRLEKGHAIPHKHNALAKGEGRFFVAVYTTYHKYKGLNYSKKKKKATKAFLPKKLVKSWNPCLECCEMSNTEGWCNGKISGGPDLLLFYVAC